MLQLFRTNQLYVLFFLFVMLVVLRIIGFVQPTEIPVYQSGLVSDLVYTLIGTKGWLPQAIALLLVFGQALLTNAICNEYQLITENTYYPALFFVLLSSFSPSMQTLSPMLLGNTFFMIALISLFRSTRSLQAADTIFNVGFWIAVASMFYSSYWVFIIVGVIGIVRLRNFKSEETIILLLGFVVPYFLVCVYFFWVDGLAGFLKKEVLEHFGCFSFHLQMTWQNFVTVIVWLMAIGAAIFNAPSFYEKTSVQAQRKVQTLFWTIGAVVLTLFTQNKIEINHLWLLIVPLSMFMAYTFLMVRNRMYAEFAFIVIMLFTLVFQYERPLLEILAR
jgi:hypothetical protein